MTKKLKVKTKEGNLVDYPFNKVKNVLTKAGFAGEQLVLATRGVVMEAAKLAKAGILSTANLEKAVVRAVANTNNLVMEKTKKITKTILK